MNESTPKIAALNLVKDYGHGKNRFRALDGVSLEVTQGQTFGLVGESGCGKSTLARAITLMDTPTEGSIVMDGQDVTHLPKRRRKAYRRTVRMVFQDPNDSLDPRYSVRQTLVEPLRTAKTPRADWSRRAAEALESVGLDRDVLERLPHEFSGGQRQRIAIARAIITEPELIVLDEPTSALDVSVQAQVLNLLVEIQKLTGMTYLFISHNLAVVRHLSHRIAVMERGQIVEQGAGDAIMDSPENDYTRKLVSSMPGLYRT